MARKMRKQTGMKTTKLKIAISALLLSGMALFVSEAADASAETSVSVDNPAKAVVREDAAAHAKGAAAKASGSDYKFEWKTEEGRKRMLGLSSSSSADSQRAEQKKALAPYEGPSSFRLIVAFVIMAVLLYGLYLFLKRFGKSISGQETYSLKLRSKLKLDSRNSLAVVQFHEDELLIAINANGGLQLLSKCSQIELAEAEANAGTVEESDSAVAAPAELSEEEASLFRSFAGLKEPSRPNGKETGKK